MGFFEQLADEYGQQQAKSLLGQEKKSFLSNSGGLFGTKNNEGLSNKERTKGAEKIGDGIFKTKDGAVFFKLTDKNKGMLSKMLKPEQGSDLTGQVGKESFQLIEAGRREVKDHVETTDSEWFFPWQFKQFNEYIDTAFGGLENALELEGKISRQESNINYAKKDKQSALDKMEDTEPREKGLFDNTTPRSIDKFEYMANQKPYSAYSEDWESKESEEKYKKFRQKRFIDNYKQAHTKQIQAESKLDSLKGLR